MSSCGMCLSGHDIGVPSSQIAYAHPLCPHHGEGCPGFTLARPDGAGRWICRCGAYQTEHPDQVTRSLLLLEIVREVNGGYESNARELSIQLQYLAVIGELVGS